MGKTEGRLGCIPLYTIATEEDFKTCRLIEIMAIHRTLISDTSALRTG